MNYIVIVFKRLRSQKLTLWLRVISLGVGMASALVLFYIAWNRLNTDNFYRDGDRIYELFDNIKSPDYSSVSASLVQPLVPAMVDDFPQVEYGTVLFINGKTTYKTEEVLFEANTVYADSSFFKIFNRRFIAGDENGSLRVKNSAVVTRKIAERLFGNSGAAINKIIYLNEVIPLVVTGVIENWPPNAGYRSGVLVSFATLMDENRLYMGWSGGDSFRGYVKLRKGVSPHEIEKEMPAFLRRHYNVDADEAKGFYNKYQLVPIAKAAFVEDPSQKVIIFIVIFIGLLIFGLVCFNSLLLILAGYGKFIKQISIHRTMGASGFDIQRLIFNEALFYVLMSALTATVFIVLVNPFVENNFRFGLGGVFTNSVFLVLFLLLIVVAFTVIYFVPVHWALRFFTSVHRKTFSYKSPVNRGLQRVLLTLQIGISLFLFSFLFIIYGQFNYIQHFNLGYSTSNIAYIELHNKPLYSKDLVIKSEIKKIPGVLSACLSDAIPLWGLPGNGFSTTPDGDKVVIVRNMSVDKDYFSTLNMKLEGPGFSNSQSKNSIVITREAAKCLGLKNPLGKNIYHGRTPLTITGVVNDFVMVSLHSAIQPVVFNIYDEPSVYSIVTFRFAPAEVQNILKKTEDVLRRIVPGQIVQVKFYDAALQENYRFDRAVKNTILFFSVLAALITLAGLVGFTLNMIQERTKELGIRKVNGASVTSLLLLLNKVFMWNILIAVVLFVPLSWLVSKVWLQQYAYAVPLNWFLFFSVSVMVSVIVIGVVSYFTFRASRRNPVEALRYE